MTREEFAAYFVDEDEEEEDGGRKAHPFMEEFLKWKSVENKRATRQDLHAFMLLDELVPLIPVPPFSADMVSAAAHDQIWLMGPKDLDRLVEVVTEEHILDLIRCGVFYDEDNDSLSMYA